MKERKIMKTDEIKLQSSRDSHCGRYYYTVFESRFAHRALWWKLKSSFFQRFPVSRESWSCVRLSSTDLLFFNFITFFSPLYARWTLRNIAWGQPSPVFELTESLWCITACSTTRTHTLLYSLLYILIDMGKPASFVVLFQRMTRNLSMSDACLLWQVPSSPKVYQAQAKLDIVTDILSEKAASTHTV